MKDVVEDFNTRVRAAIKERLDELGMTQYRFVRNHPGIVLGETLSKIMNGHTTPNLRTLVKYFDLLGLELKIIKKDENND